MNSLTNKSIRQSLRFGLLCLLAVSFGAPTARAGLTFTVDIIRYNLGNSYRFYTPISTNTTAPAQAVGMYFFSSPQWPTNGSTRQYEMTTNGFNPNPLYGYENSYSDYASMMQQITNGTWTILFTNAITTNLYTFTVSAPNMTSNMLPATIITFPLDGALNVTNQPNFTWQGPANMPLNDLYSYVANYDFSFYQPATIPAGNTNWTITTPIPNGLNCFFSLNYITNFAAPLFVATIPLSTNLPHTAISGWASASTLETGDGVSFAVTNPPATGISLIAHYTFDNSGNLGQDTSGHGYDLDFNGGSGVTSSGTAKAGSGAASFDGGSFFSYTSTPSNVLSALAGDFTLSFWIKTTQTYGGDGEPGWQGAGIVAADIPGTYYDSIPAALDGGEIGFFTGAPYEDTLNSSMDLNDGSYHHVVITRDQTTGDKQIYVDGVLNNSDSATMNPLSDPRIVAIGCSIDASQSNPANAGTGNYFQGLLDDIQIYSGVLSSNAVAQLYANPGSTASLSGGGHTLIAHYAFDNSGDQGLDSTGNGNDINCGSGWGPGQVFSTDAIAGGGALQFFGGSSIYPCGQAFTSWTNVFAGSFTVSAWINTTSVVGNDGDDLRDYNGQSVIYADNNNLGATPVALTGTKAAFRTTDPDGHDDTLHSVQSVTTGSYVHIVATRDQITGEKKIYINGTLDSSDFASTESLTGAQYVSIGGESGSAYSGLVDDVQIYSGVLAASDVVSLYDNPGTTIPNSSGTDFNIALGTTNMNWATSGGTSWFVETTNTYNGAPAAAQSGSVTNSQSSTLSVTVTGPGTLTFYWASQDDCNNFDYEFDIDGSYKDDISCSRSWYQDGPFTIPAGQHTLSWTTHAYGDTDPTEAGFLDQVSFVAGTAPVITINPFSQTNYPGYNVALFAAATSNPTATWQWFKVAGGMITSATNALFIPTNSGTAGVVGSYYAIASNLSGSANTTTASVSFVTAPLPPDWAHAVKSPFGAVDATTFTRDYYLGCAADSAGDIYAAVQYNGNMDVLTNGIVENVLTAPGGYAAALVKHAVNGNPLWAVGLTNNQTGYSYGIAVAAGPGNGAYLASDFSGTNWLGTNKFVDVGGNSILLSRFDASGSNVWSKFIGGTNAVYTSYNMLVSDVSGNVTLAGNMSGTVSFGGTNLSAPSGGGFIVQYDANGAVRWAQTIPVYTYNLAYGSGLLYLSLQSAITSGITNASIGSLSNVTDRAWAVACLNASNGQPLWLRGVGHQYGANTTGLLNDMPRISASGTNVFLIANAYGSSAVFGGISVPLPGGRGQYFARYDTNGNPQGATSFGSPTTEIWASTANATGVYVCGDFDNYSQFGSEVIAAPVYAQNDLGPLYFTQPFIAKFDGNGNPLWARNGVSSDLANFRGIATTSDGVWAGGFLKITNSIPAQFGTNFVYSDLQIIIGSPFSYNVWNQAGMIAKITETTAATPVILLSPQTVGANFQFHFLSQSGFNHNILYRTNLVVGNWLTNSTVAGDGTLKTSSVPLAVFSPAKQGFIRVSTQ